MQRPCQFSKKGGFCKITERNKGDGLCLSRSPLPPPLAGNTVFFTDKTAFSRFFSKKSPAGCDLPHPRLAIQYFKGNIIFLLPARPVCASGLAPAAFPVQTASCSPFPVAIPSILSYGCRQFLSTHLCKEQLNADHSPYLNMPYRHPAQFGPGQTADGCPPLLIPFILLA